MSKPPRYVGRFAPSPTGPLHFGSLLAAVASYLEAGRRDGSWLVRIEDIDPPREEPGASARILEALDRYGFAISGSTTWQSASGPAHSAAIARLVDADLAYYCDCSRKNLAEADMGPLGAIYPGTCRHRSLTPADSLAIRVRTGGARIAMADRLQGAQAWELEASSGDFVIRRRDGFVAYQLAVVVDDHLQGVTDIVRGIDLLDSTPRQVWLQQLLGCVTPGYAHIPVAVDAEGRKLAKSTSAEPLPLEHPAPTLYRALLALQQRPPKSLERASLATLWEWAREHWKLDRLRGVQAVPAPPAAMVQRQNPIL
jgi:glutamyl-Q tRNA(Asp) synthetase